MHTLRETASVSSILSLMSVLAAGRGCISNEMRLQGVDLLIISILAHCIVLLR